MREIPNKTNRARYREYIVRKPGRRAPKTEKLILNLWN
jgi:hypothetical protein